MEGVEINNKGYIKKVNNGIQRLSPEVKCNMSFSLSFCLRRLCTAAAVY